MTADRARFSCEANILKLNEKEQMQTRARMEHLKKSMELGEYKFGIRDDSKLVFNYCTDHLNWKESAVMEELCIIQWISENSDYQSLCEVVIRKVVEQLKQQYGIGDWSVMFRIVKLYVPDIIKQHIVGELGLPEMKKIRWGDSEWVIYIYKTTNEAHLHATHSPHVETAGIDYVQSVSKIGYMYGSFAHLHGNLRLV